MKEMKKVGGKMRIKAAREKKKPNKKKKRRGKYN